MSDQCYQSLSIGQMRWNAMIDALSAPGPAIGLTMAGYSTIAREAGFNFWMSLATSLGIWGLPGQVVFSADTAKTVFQRHHLSARRRCMAKYQI